MSPIKWTVLCIQLPLTFRTVFTNFELVPKRVEIWNICQKVQVVELFL